MVLDRLQSIVDDLDVILPTDLTTFKKSQSTKNIQYCVVTYNYLDTLVSDMCSSVYHYTLYIYVIDSEIADTPSLTNNVREILDTLKTYPDVLGAVVSESGIFLGGKEAITIQASLYYSG